VLCINPEKGIRRFQCGGFFLGTNTRTAVVEATAQVDRLQSALNSGVLLDITEEYKKLGTNETVSIAGNTLRLSEEDTQKKFYLARQGGTLKVLFSENQDEQKVIEESAAKKSVLVLPEGFEDEEKYLIKVTPLPPE
jgi:hypothetical protein